MKKRNHAVWIKPQDDGRVTIRYIISKRPVVTELS